MKTPSPNLCPHCGQSIPAGERKAAKGKNAGNETHESQKPAEEASEYDHPEYDHRGVLMPRRTRIGGIIIPQ